MPLVMPVQRCVCAFPHTHFIITECLVSTIGGDTVDNACAGKRRKCISECLTVCSKLFIAIFYVHTARQRNKAVGNAQERGAGQVVLRVLRVQLRVGQNRVHTPYMTVYLVILLPKKKYICIYAPCISGSGQP